MIPKVIIVIVAVIITIITITNRNIIIKMIIVKMIKVIVITIIKSLYWEWLKVMMKLLSSFEKLAICNYE